MGVSTAWGIHGVFVGYSWGIHMCRLCIGYVSVMCRLCDGGNEEQGGAYSSHRNALKRTEKLGG